ncbi:MAG: PEP-CTERM sorting domain-containing protein [Burkholderiaceae bacterium]|nr:PEP-CTERM sorting domain-containing protein [Burkholderiaceae bacterium]
MNMSFFRIAAAGLTLAAGLSSAQAATLAADGSWAGFNVDGNLPPYALGWIDDEAAALSFSFTIPTGFKGMLTVVDAGFSGDEFRISNGANVLGNTSAAVNGDALGAIEFSFDAALANAHFSRAVFTLDSGAYDISGLLIKSTSLDGVGDLNATFGAVRLEIAPVPEPATLATLLAGLALLTAVLRRRDSK